MDTPNPTHSTLVWGKKETRAPDKQKDSHPSIHPVSHTCILPSGAYQVSAIVGGSMLSSGAMCVCGWVCVVFSSNICSWAVAAWAAGPWKPGRGSRTHHRGRCRGSSPGSRPMGRRMRWWSWRAAQHSNRPHQCYQPQCSGLRCLRQWWWQWEHRPRCPQPWPRWEQRRQEHRGMRRGPGGRPGTRRDQPPECRKATGTRRS
mmetsp:Transcript_20259/g.49222  ORF Transcript_20259/g.49222 Transcript_20259/m.49222 type:complete len:202 (-) Transcript_20259:179-784(-)